MTLLLSIVEEKPAPSCRLESLDVSDCSLWTRGCMDIMKAAMICKHLRALSLAGNDAAAPTCIVAAELFQKNATLEELDLSNCGITPQAMDMLARALSQNISVRHVMALLHICSCVRLACLHCVM